MESLIFCNLAINVVIVTLFLASFLFNFSEKKTMDHQKKKTNTFFSRMKRHTAFAAIRSVERVRGIGKVEGYLKGRLIGRWTNSAAKLIPLAWKAEKSEHFTLALTIWLRVAELSEGVKKDHKIYHKALGKIAGLETRLRRQIDMYSGPNYPQILPSILEGADPEIVEDKVTLKSSEIKNNHEFLTDFWQNRIGQLSGDCQRALLEAYCTLGLKRIKKGGHFGVMRALQPALYQFPEHQKAYELYYKSVLLQVTTNKRRREEYLRGWWNFYAEHQEYITPETWETIWSSSEKAAQRLLLQGDPRKAVSIISPAFQVGPDKTKALVILAKASADQKDWVNAAYYWQLYAAITNPVTTKSRTHVADNVEERLRKSKYGLKELRGARLNRAFELHNSGQFREFNELVGRIVESIPDQRMLKNNRQIIDLVRTYVQDALKADGVSLNATRPKDGKPLKIAICLDVLKISASHTEADVIFAICRNLIKLDERIETHVIVTNERFTVTTPVISHHFNPNRNDLMHEAAQQALPEFYGKRFFMHGLKCIGLEGVIDTCKDILKIGPDVVLYGGGHKGMFSNESRVIRHCLYDCLPTAFFYTQVDNEVDDKNDMIIPFGPHAILGDKGNAHVRPQPYPTIGADSFVKEVPVDFTKMEKKIIVSAITGGRMDALISKMSDADMKSIFSILDRVPGAVWHLFGSRDPKILIKNNPMIARRVKAKQMVIHPVVPIEEFTKFINNTSLFFHLPGITGGSGGATVARQAGIPIVTFKHSEVSGRQPATTVFDENAIKPSVEFSVRLLKNRTEWSKTVKAQFSHINWIIETSAEGFYNCLTQTVTTSQHRMKTSGVKQLKPSQKSLTLETRKKHKNPILSLVENKA